VSKLPKRWWFWSGAGSLLLVISAGYLVIAVRIMKLIGTYKHWLVILAIVACVRGLFPCHSALKAQNTNASNATPAGKGDAAQLDSLIRQLGSLDFTQRGKATEELEAKGCAVLEALRKASHRDKDPEVRQRAALIVQRLENRLDGLAADYRSFGMPFPPQSAKLVRFVNQIGERIDGKWIKEKYRFGFLIKPSRSAAPATMLVEAEQYELNWDIKARVLDPDKMALREIEDLRHQSDSSGGEGIVFAIHCKARGWDKLASAVFEEWRKDEERSPHTAMVQMAWEYWRAQLYEPGTDWKMIAGRLKDLTAADGSLDIAPNRALLRSLDLALVPSQAKPGSVAALIDRLIDCRTTYSGLDDPKSHISTRPEVPRCSPPRRGSRSGTHQTPG
jgi:hypothetical protein